MHIQVITLFPEMFSALAHSIPGRAQKKGLLTLSYLNPRDFTTDKQKTVDDKPYGGGAGMVMKFEPLYQAIQTAQETVLSKHCGAPPPQVSYLSPQGRLFNHLAAEQLAQRQHLILIAGRYEGVDQRLLDQVVDEEWSLGDFVLSGGELAAMCLIDAVTRLIDGVLGDAESALNDSFSNTLLDYPHYTRPASVAGHKVPKILLSGDHEAIARWRLKQALGRTWQRRPELLKKRVLTPQEQVLLAEFIDENSE